MPRSTSFAVAAGTAFAAAADFFASAWALSGMFWPCAAADAPSTMARAKQRKEVDLVMASLQSRPPRPAEPTLLSGPPAVTRIRIVAASGAGLAYSNGLRSSVSQGRVGYYVERNPELPQTVRFVVGVIKDGQPDRALGEAVMAQAFGESRASACTFRAWEQYLQGIEGPSTRLQRLYGRDLWMT